MELNQFLFPAPTPSYSSAGFIGEIIYVPKYARDEQSGEVIQFVDPKAGPENDDAAAAGAESSRSTPRVMDPEQESRRSK